MLENITLYGIDYYKKNTFMGSYKGMNFRLHKSGEEEHPVLEAIAWRGPFIFDKTKEEKFTHEFEFSEDGIIAASEWLFEEQKELYLFSKRV